MSLRIMALVACSFAGSITAADNETILERAEKIALGVREKAIAGKMLDYTMSREFPDVVIFANRIPKIFHELGPDLSGGKLFVQEGNPSSVDDERVTHHFAIFTKAGGGIAVKLGYDPDLDKFHVIGYEGVRLESYGEADNKAE